MIYILQSRLWILFQGTSVLGIQGYCNLICFFSSHILFLRCLSLAAGPSHTLWCGHWSCCCVQHEAALASPHMQPHSRGTSGTHTLYNNSPQDKVKLRHGCVGWSSLLTFIPFSSQLHCVTQREEHSEVEPWDHVFTISNSSTLVQDVFSTFQQKDNTTASNMFVFNTSSNEHNLTFTLPGNKEVTNLKACTGTL